ncbi:RNA polymerase B [Boothiomyces sp. JEL0838]|nr:RNA polymerase B [Boothiomyces sp. JEL0838]
MSFRHRQVVEEENANTCEFGSEFQNVQCLLISEVKVLLEMNKERKKQQSGDDSISEMMQKTIDYCQKFSRFKNKQTVKQIRSLFPDDQYHEFEMAQLANLACESAEEAVTLIPSLQRIPEDELQMKLNELSDMRKYQ